jgi:hypothetical protein
LIEHVIHDTVNQCCDGKLRIFFQRYVEFNESLFRIVIARQTAESSARAAASATATTVGSLLRIQLNPDFTNIMIQVLSYKTNDLLGGMLFYLDEADQLLTAEYR